MVRTPCFHCWSAGSIPGQGTKILQATCCSRKKRRKELFLDKSFLYKYVNVNESQVMEVGKQFMKQQGI